MTKYINPLTDFGFKRIFGNKEILKEFLNELLPIKHKIAEITFKNIEKLGTSEEDRKAIFDLSCIDDIGNEFIVELQRAKQTHFQDRALYYTTFPIQEQAQRGSWDFKLTKIFFIGILDFSIEHFNDKEYLHHGQIIDINSKKVMSDKLNFIYIELTKFKKNHKELANELEKWIYILSNLSKLKDIPKELEGNKTIKNIFDIASYSKLNTQDRDEYDRNLKVYRDLVNSLDTAKNDGKKEAKLEIAKNLLDVLDVKTVAKKTGLSIEEIEKLK